MTSTLCAKPVRKCRPVSVMFRIYGYVNDLTGEHHVALVKGEIGDGKNLLCRVHSECLTGDVFGSRRCDCGQQLAAAMQQIDKEGRGVLLYMRQEGRGIGLINKLRRMSCRKRASIPLRQTSSSALRPTCANTGSALKCCRIWGLRKSAS